MSRISTSFVAGASALALVAGSFNAAEAAPLPAQSAVQVGGQNATIDNVGWRRGYYGGGYGYRRGYGGRAAAGAALGIIGGALAASAAPRYGYYGGYGYPAYGYGYAPARTYAYPAYGYPAYGYDDYGW